MAQEDTLDVELIELPDVSSGDEEVREIAVGVVDEIKKKRRRRRRKHGGKSAMISAAEILANAARDNVESSPSSFMEDPQADGRGRGRGMSALELDAMDSILCDDTTDDSKGQELLMTSTTGTPASLDSSRSLWELGTVEDDATTPSGETVMRRPPISGRGSKIRAFSIEDGKSKIDELTSGIESILKSIPNTISSGDRALGRLCLPSGNSTGSATTYQRPASNRLCIDKVRTPEIDFSRISSFFESVSSTLVSSIDAIQARFIDSPFAQPDSVVQDLLAKLEGKKDAATASAGDKFITADTVPITNRKQRRLIEQRI